MSRFRARRVDRETAERLLRGEPVDPQVGLDPLADLLAAAAATTHDGELAGEQAAMSAFRAAHLRPVTLPRRPSVLAVVFAKLLTVKLAAGLAAGAVGGVAVAAAAGVLPAVPGTSPAGPPADSRLTGQASASQAPPATTDAAERAEDARAGGQRAEDARAGGQHGEEHPAFLGLCRAYFADAAAHSDRVLDNPAFSALVTAAGGEQEVPGYCSVVVRDATAPGRREDVPPGPPAGLPAPSAPETPARPFGAGPGSAPPAPPAPAAPKERPAPPVEPGVSPAPPDQAPPAPVPPARPVPPAPHPVR